ncbi:hypothetical protein Sinac_0349 [Singulisphaera acidiphila DSM 18658]|uniref:Uncharacterized protein n=1 Tax=Singulisphaera acidiphila (strain ATCC BAA-1392 / DSM 18658 / VKM B-2454 / MOB10) TaxID=886293 RepID=L0D813_SINAD|nr:hypothetical protein Sinac_0349 [Singulisphaera acidiphila DSM 18658]
MLHVTTSLSEKRRSALRDFVTPRIISDSLFGDWMTSNANALLDNCRIFSSAQVSESHAFGDDIGGRASECTEWLVDTVVAFLKSEMLPIVLVKDFVGSPSDPVFIKDIPDLFWTHNDKLYWPITKDMANVKTCRDILSWSAGGPVVVFLCSPVDLSDLPANQRRLSLSESQANRFRNSVRHVILDIFDSEGCVVLSSPRSPGN